MVHKVLVSDDHDLYRDGMISLVLQVAPQAEVLQAENFFDTKKILSNHPDISLVILDLHMPGAEGLKTLKEIKDKNPLLTVLVVSSQDLAVRVQKILDTGADGFIAKTISRENMLEALKQVLNGEYVVLSEELTSQISVLTPRQQTILECIAAGKANKEIATFLGITDSTVREHVSMLFKSLKVSNRVQAVNKAKRMGYVVDDV